MPDLNFNGREIIERRLQVLNIVWISMLSSVFLVIIIKESIVNPAMIQHILPEKQLSIILYVIGVSALLGAGFIKNVLIHQRKENNNLGIIVQNYMSAVIISMAISESVIFFGFVGLMLGATDETFYIMALISLAGLIYFRPRRDEILSMIPPEILRDE